MLNAKLALRYRDKQLAEKYARYLARVGFVLVKTSPRGVYFRGSPNSFEKTFQAKIEDREFANEPVMPDYIDPSIASVYFPTKPTYFV
ncbi:MAG: hypothetical protein QNJ64_11150 [Crocosphaera sp.]|nr:hypothetical protein [Crocosphaera sp.]